MAAEQYDGPSVQINVADNVESAGRDFIKITVAPSAADFLNTAAEEEIYRATEANPNLFKLRFGVAVADRAVRGVASENGK